MVDVVISGTGLYVPEGRIDNEELVTAYNAFVDQFNTDNAEAIAAGTVAAKAHSSADFIEKASGIQARHMISTDGVSDKDRMMQALPDGVYGSEDEPSLQAAMGIKAADMALKAAGLEAKDIDQIVFSAAAVQRYFPAMGIEIQHFMGTSGSAFDMVMGCSSATYGLINGVNAIKSGVAKRVLMVNPEIFSSMVNYRDRDSHFIFGDIATAVVLERADLATSADQWTILDTKAETKFSHNITTNFGPFTRLDDDALNRDDMFFVQQGRKVFKELLPLVTDFISAQLQANSLTVDHLSRMWLHQANINMNKYAAKKLLDREPTFADAPTVLEEYGNTAGAGSIIAFHKHRSDLKSGDKGLICSFGAGYSIGSLLVQKV